MNGWKILGALGFVTLGAFVLSPVAILLLALVERLYRLVRVAQADRVELDGMRADVRHRQVRRQMPDSHGFGGVVFDASSGTWRNLDTGETWTPERTTAEPDAVRLGGVIRQRLLAALTGTTVSQRVVRSITADEPPELELEAAHTEWLHVEDGGGRGGSVEL